jgi:hypothetical protein
VKSAVSGSGTFAALRAVEGLTRDSFVQKLSAKVTPDSPSFTISAVSKTTKVYTNPESTQLIASDIVDIEDFTK